MSKWATHGCIHVEPPYIQRLFDWAEVRKTLVVIRGKRVWALEDQLGEVDEGITEEKEEGSQEEEGRLEEKTQQSEEIQERKGNHQGEEDQQGE